MKSTTRTTKILQHSSHFKKSSSSQDPFLFNNPRIISKKTHTCSECQKTFSRAFTMKEHLRRHAGTCPFKCGFCTKTFPSLGDRNRHEKLHTGEKKYICEMLAEDGTILGCGRRFARTDGLMAHHRSDAGRDYAGNFSRDSGTSCIESIDTLRPLDAQIVDFKDVGSVKDPVLDPHIAELLEGQRREEEFRRRRERTKDVATQLGLTTDGYIQHIGICRENSEFEGQPKAQLHEQLVPVQMEKFPVIVFTW